MRKLILTIKFVILKSCMRHSVEMSHWLITKSFKTAEKIKKIKAAK